MRKFEGMGWLRNGIELEGGPSVVGVRISTLETDG